MAFLFLVRSVRVLGSKARLAQCHRLIVKLEQGLVSRLLAFPSAPWAQAFSLVPHPCNPLSLSSAFRAELPFHDSIFWRIFSGS